MRHGHRLCPGVRPGWASGRAGIGVRTLVAVALALLVVAGCTSHGSSPTPDRGAAQQVATALAAALTNKDVSPVAFTGATGTEINDLFAPLVRGMGPLKPQVSAQPVVMQGSSASAALDWSWTFPGVSRPWTYQSTVELAQEGPAGSVSQWKPTWTPAIVEPRLDGSNRLSQQRRYPQRGELLGAAGASIVTERPVVRIGIDKARIKAGQQAASARRLAKLVRIGPDGYVQRVTSAGREAFVEAITFRAQDPARPTDRAVAAIPGAIRSEGEAMLAPDRDFARALIGTVGEATAQSVQDSRGAVVAGDEVGLSGLQLRYDARLRGTPGVSVQAVPLNPPGSSASPDPVPNASAAPTSAAGSASTLFTVRPVNGQDLTTTLAVDLQKLAEKTLTTTRPASALVAVQPSTGSILAAANGPGANGQALATTGRIAPGSTFKVASALALLRAGLTPSSRVSCPKTVQVGGRTYKNYRDYPGDQLGTITLQTAIAQSCNTAFVGQRNKLRPGDLAAAAASLGLGTDYDVGFPSFFGSVPAGGNDNAQAEAVFGQGTVEASPMAMAAVAASVEAAHTVIPHLVEGVGPPSTATPLSTREANELRQMMRAVVTQGSGRRLAGLSGTAVIAKTGTAEYGTKAPYRTHAWMIAAHGDLAVAVYVADGDSGSGTAGPLLESFLRHAH